MGIVSLPICNIQLRGAKPDRRPYPKELLTYGDHIKKHRLALNLSQPKVADILNVQTDTVTNWELNRFEPQLNHIPKIISFLGYTPKFNIENPIKQYRINQGLILKKLAEILGIDSGTLARIEKGESSRTFNKIKSKIRELIDTIT